MRTTTVVVNGAAGEAVQVVAIRDLKRQYVGLYSQLGSCKISIGEGNHANESFVIAAGNLYELQANTLDQISYSTTGTILNIIQDRDSYVTMTYDFLVLTYDGSTIAYNKRAVLAPPVFK
jgi:hypothetical protein